MAQKDFYKVLGVSETASPDEIKKAYRKLAKKNHPDATGGDKKKEALFKEITEAHETLSDPKRREEYDALRKNPFAGRAPGGAGFEGFPGFGGFPGGAGGARGGRGRRPDMNIDLNDLFGGAGGFAEAFGGGFSESATGRGRRTQRGADLQTSIELTLAEAALGTEKTLVLEPQADGGRKLTMRIPAGVEDGETIKVPGQGRAGTRNGPPGDLLLQVHVQPHPAIRRKGTDLEVDVPLRIDEAVLGTKAEVTTLEGKVHLTVPPGTSSGLKLRLRGKGAGDRKGGRGDLYAVIQIAVPKKISDEARELITQFAKLTAEEPR